MTPQLAALVARLREMEISRKRTWSGSYEDYRRQQATVKVIEALPTLLAAIERMAKGLENIMCHRACPCSEWPDGRPKTCGIHIDAQSALADVERMAGGEK